MADSRLPLAEGTGPIVRFAPSPTGFLHIGNARPALLNWLFAQERGGTFILRYDDTDAARSTEEFALAIAEDLAWLGIRPDRVERQSARGERHAAAADQLRAAGRLYPSYETEEELDYRRKRQLAMGRPPIYDRAALKLTAADRERLEAEGRRPYWRFLLEARAVGWDDLVRGPQTIDCASLSDPVLIRADGSYLYTLPSVVDDIDLAITHVIRGEDHVTNTAVQIQLFEALGAAPPVFAHHNLLTLPSGEGLSKRLGHLSLRELREEGFEWSAVATLATTLGTAQAVTMHFQYGPIHQLSGTLDLSRVSHSAAKFDLAELAATNARIVHHHLSYEDVRERLAALGADGGPAFWEAVRGNITKVPEAREWWTVVAGPVAPVAEDADRELLARARSVLPLEPWDAGTWARWTEVVKAETGRKGRALYRPLRLALTGLEHGPELKALLPLIGRDKALARLSGTVA